MNGQAGHARNRRRLGLQVGCVLLIGTAATVASSTQAGAAATTLSVDGANPACSDAGSGSAAPFCTIKHAAKVATAGQTVIVSAGTYAGDITPAFSGTSTAPITFVVGPGADVTVKGGTDGFKVSSRSWIVIDGFNVTATTGAGIYLSSSTNVTVTRDHVSYAGLPKSGSTARGIRLSGTSNSTVSHNTTDHNSDAGIALSGTSNANVVTGNLSFANARGYTRAAAGFDLRDGTGNVVTSNVSHDNEDSGYNIWTGTSGALVSDNVSYKNGDHGIDIHNATNAAIVANTVTSNVDSGIEMTTSTGTHLANNIATDNGINSPRTSGNLRADSASISSTTTDFDLVSLRVPGVMIDWAGTKYSTLAAFQAATGREPHGIGAAPLFVASATGDFHLAAGSPGIDAADSATFGQPALDADGFARVDDPATLNTGSGPVTYADRGAYEYQP